MIIADLHIHGKYSQATSRDVDIPNLEKWAKIKGVDLLGTGDFTHPKWFEHLKNELARDEKGIYYTKTNFPFVLSTEISLMYSQAGKGRRVHNIVLAPSMEIAGQITDYLKTKGRVDYDGRPIFNISCIEFAENLRKISDKIEVIPAHCLLPDELVHINTGIKEIKELKENDEVLTHKGRFRRIKKIYTREYSGKALKIIPSCLKEGTYLTPEHPVYIIKSHKSCKNVSHTICKPTCAYLKRGCKNKRFEDYNPEWIQAKNIEIGDIILYPRYNEIEEKNVIYLNEILNGFFIDGDYLKPKKEKIGTKNIPIKNKIEISKDFCRLIGYYLAEGYVSRDKISFTFNKNETGYIEDVKRIMTNTFGNYIRFYKEKDGSSFSIHSKILYYFFNLFYHSKPYNASSKKIIDWMLKLPFDKQKEIFLGWWRGDTGYTVSKILANQMKTILLRFGIIPSISKILASDVKFKRINKPCFINNREIKINHDLYHFTNLSFFKENLDLLEYKEFKKYKTKLDRRRCWIDNNFVYLPVFKIEKKNYNGQVFNLEVEDDNSYVTSSLIIHNCWTPWFGLLGSKSGFDSVEEGFGDQSRYIHALETGLSSDPAMNWRLSKLDKYNLVSFSDLHSFWPYRLGREATIFDIDLSYDNLLKALRTKEGLKGTIEVEPAYGKYHWDGHRNCGVCFKPDETRKLKGICPKCGKPLTIGVEYRVEQLADRPCGFKPKEAVPYYSLIPLSELLSKILGKAVSTRTVWAEYNKLVSGSSEYEVLLRKSFEDLKKISGEKIAGLVIRNREGKIKIKPGYDGVYGEITLDKEQKSLAEF